MDENSAILERLRAAALADEDLQRALADCSDVRVLAAVTAERLALSVEQAAGALDHAARALADPPAWVLGSAPPRQWLPVQIFADAAGAKVEWIHFGFAPLAEPFFEQSLARAMALPASALLRCATPLDALLEFAAAPMPDGLIFHMSRCGSTLVAQMLGALEGSVVVAEAPVLDQAIQLHLAGQLPAEIMRGLTGALLRERTDVTRRRFVKLDAWHTLVLPRIAGLFRESRWTFLFRDPVEVLVSQERSPGMHVTPGAIPFELFGLRGAEAVAAGDHAAWVIGAIARAGLAAAGTSGGRLVDYADLPGAVASSILPHFGIVPQEADAEQLTAASGRYSKTPHRAFADDRIAKQEEASAQLRARAEALGLRATHHALLRACREPASAAPNFRLARFPVPASRVAVNFGWDP